MCLPFHPVPAELLYLKLGADLKGKTSLPTSVNGNKYTYKSISYFKMPICRNFQCGSLHVYHNRDDLRSALNLSIFLFVLLFRTALVNMSKFHSYPVEFRYIVELLGLKGMLQEYGPVFFKIGQCIMCNLSLTNKQRIRLLYRY